MGGKERGNHTVTEEEGSRNENTMEMKKVGIFDCFISMMREVNGMEMKMKMEEDDLFDPCSFLVRAKANSSNKTSILGQSCLCVEEDFHYIDLVWEETTPNYFPSIINYVETGTMLSFDYREVYILGDKSQPLIQHDHHVDGVHTHTGASHLSASSCCDWEAFVTPGINGLKVNPAVLSDKLYSFGYPLLFPQVYDPKPSNSWTPLRLPKDLADTDVSFPLLPDPLNKRIIFHLPGLSKLYAFYPDEKEDALIWKPLASNFEFESWDCIAAAIADNIIFFLPADVHDIGDFLLAYDLRTSIWLDIEWDFSKVDYFLIVYHAIFTLSNKGLMCLASGICDSSVHFLRFRVNHTSETLLTLTAIDYQKYDIPSATSISDIIFFQESML